MLLLQRFYALGGIVAAVVSLIWEMLLLQRLFFDLGGAVSDLGGVAADVSDLGGVVAAAVSLFWEVLLLQRCL